MICDLKGTFLKDAIVGIVRNESLERQVGIVAKAPTLPVRQPEPQLNMA